MTAKKLGDVSSTMQGQGSTELSVEQLKSQLSIRHSGFRDEDPLFSTPQDLVCPITLSLYQDPVINGTLGAMQFESTAMVWKVSLGTAAMQPTAARIMLCQLLHANGQLDCI